MKTGKLSNNLLEKSFLILVDQESISKSDQTINKTEVARTDFIKNYFTHVPVEVSEDSVNSLVDELGLDVNDFKNKIAYKKGSKYTVQSVVLKEDLNMSLVEAIKDADDHALTSENEDRLPRGRTGPDSDSDISEGEIERWSNKSRSRASRKVFNTTGKWT